MPFNNSRDDASGLGVLGFFEWVEYGGRRFDNIDYLNQIEFGDVATNNGDPVDWYQIGISEYVQRVRIDIDIHHFIEGGIDKLGEVSHLFEIEIQTDGAFQNTVNNYQVTYGVASVGEFIGDYGNAFNAWFETANPNSTDPAERNELIIVVEFAQLLNDLTTGLYSGNNGFQNVNAQFTDLANRAFNTGDTNLIAISNALNSIIQNFYIPSFWINGEKVTFEDFFFDIPVNGFTGFFKITGDQYEVFADSSTGALNNVYYDVDYTLDVSWSSQFFPNNSNPISRASGEGPEAETGEETVTNQGGTLPAPNDNGMGDNTPDISMPTSLDDILFGTEFDDTIDGLSGNDTISGLNGNDTLFGNTGNDTIYGGRGADTISGGDGEDIINGNQGNDVINGGKGNDNLDGGEGQGNDIINGNGGNDIINGRNGSDTLTGGSGNDTISGQNRNDVIIGNKGNDILNGNQGNDTILGGDEDDTLNGGAGNDTLNGQSNEDVLNGGGQNDILNGGNGLDDLFGGSGRDILNGGKGNDMLDGGTGDDQLFGNGGSDILIGGVGNDSLNGGSDAGDVFVFDASHNGTDRITDFQDGLDKLHFTGGISAVNIMVSDAGSSGQNARIDITGMGITIIINDIDHTLIDVNDFMFS